MNRTGFSDKQNVTIEKVDYATQMRSGKIVAVKCRTVQDSVFMPLFVKNTSPVVSLGDCPIIPGNSGSPIFDESGEVRGIVNSTQVALERFGQKVQLVLRGFGVNFSCINTGVLGVGYGLPPECVNITSESDFRAALDDLYRRTYEGLKAAILQKEEIIRDKIIKQNESNSPLVWVPFENRPADSRWSLIEWQPQCYARRISKLSMFNITDLLVYIDPDQEGRLHGVIQEVPIRIEEETLAGNDPTILSMKLHPPVPHQVSKANFSLQTCLREPANR